jgi:DNA-nicking Smr family endonuclease
MARKPLHLPDHVLWDELRHSITPLRHKAQGRNLLQGKLQAPSDVKPVRAVQAPAPRKTNQRDVAPPLAAMDRRTAQRLNRGQIEPEGRLDLHGEGLETARIHLLHFLLAERQRGKRLVLVITGKGASPYTRHTLHGLSHFHAPEREGRLRREVPLWLHEESFRQHVVGLQPAHPRHGGGGAFYVRLRRAGFAE